MKKKYYIAYGSNLSVEQMACRCPDAKIAGQAVLAGWELLFRGCATIAPNPKKNTPVLVWEISERDEGNLDLYQLTPSIILEIVKWRKETGRDCKIIFTAHDYQLVCPNHMLNNPNTHQNCEKCLGGHFVNCMKGKCIHGSTAKSAIGMMKAEFWKWKGTYKYIDTMICCSEFMKSKMDSNPLFATKTVAMHNFIDKVEWKETEKKDYVLYFGRFSEEKGIGTLIKVCKKLPDVQFIFAGTGPLEETVNGIKNIKNVGFQKGEALEKLIREARFSIYPSEWYENCPFSVMESQMYGTPVLGANIGGIPELIQVGKTGELFESGNAEDLKGKIEKLWGDKKLCAEYGMKKRVGSFSTSIKKNW